VPKLAGVFANGTGLVASSSTPNLPYWKESTPVASLFIAIHIRSKWLSFGSDGSVPCLVQTVYHWLLGGADPDEEGASCIVNTSFSMVLPLLSRPKSGSATKSWRTFTLGSGGVFAPPSLSLPSGLRSFIARMPGSTHGVAVTPATGATSGQYGPSPAWLMAVT